MNFFLVTTVCTVHYNTKRAILLVKISNLRTRVRRHKCMVYQCTRSNDRQEYFVIFLNIESNPYSKSIVGMESPSIILIKDKLFD